MDQLTIEAQGLNIAFPGVKALTNVDFTLRKGEIRALVGKNGAGKSTLIKIITGMYRPDSGRLFIDGTEVKNATPEVMSKLGVEAIYQDNDLIPFFTVGESIMLKNEPKKGLFIDKKALHAKAASILSQSLGVDIDPYMLVGDLNVSQQQLVQIASTLVKTPKIMIFDEPTAALSMKEIEKLFEIIFSLKNHGVSVIYISHYLEEIFRIADTVTILCDGVKVSDMKLSETDENQIISLMAGNEQFNKAKARSFHRTDREIVLSIRGLNNGFLKDIDFDLYKGEILGFFGEEGAGQQEIARALYGESSARFESLKLFGKETELSNPTQAIRHGIAYIPRDRHAEGVVRGFNVRENVTLPKIRDFSRFGFIDERKEERITLEQIEKLSIKTPSTTTPIINLSGGNQQKVVLARWIVVNPRILILDYPTIGIDVRAKNEVYKILISLAERGMSLILITPEYEEIAMLCDRLIVMKNGRIKKELRSDEFSESRILSYAIGSETGGENGDTI